MLWLYGISLHRAFHYHSSMSLYDLNNFERDIKHKIIIMEKNDV